MHCWVSRSDRSWVTLEAYKSGVAKELRVYFRRPRESMARRGTVGEILDRWCNTALSDQEVPLGELVESIQTKAGRFVLKKPRPYSNGLVVSTSTTPPST